MARKKDTPQKAMMREFMQSYLKENDVKIKAGTDVNSIMRDMMSVILEGALDEELAQELGYSKYDYRNKSTDNSLLKMLYLATMEITKKQSRGGAFKSGSAPIVNSIYLTLVF